MKIHTVELPLGEPGRHEVVLLADHAQALAKMLAERNTAQAQLAEATGLIEKSADLAGELGDYLVSLAKRHSGTELLDHERNLRTFLARHAQAEQPEPQECSCPKIGERFSAEKHAGPCPVHDAALATQPAVRGAEHE